MNIANFALGRNETGAIGIVNVDETSTQANALAAAVDEIRKIGAVKDAWLVRL